MKNVLSKLNHFILRVFVLITASPLWAAIPKPPDSDIASENKDWLDVGKGLMTKALSIACIALGAMILIGVASVVLKSYHIAHEKQDLGHFFKMLICGLIAAVVGIGLVYAGSLVLDMQS